MGRGGKSKKRAGVFSSAIPRRSSGIVLDRDGDVEWRNDAGELHREDGPARTDERGNQEWYLNGQLHRVGGPARIDDRGNEEWYLHGQLHREGGPARIDEFGSEMWYLNGQLHRVDGPAVVSFDGQDEEWYMHGELHHEDGPARKYRGQEEWYLNGQLHREGGPAVIGWNKKEWWVNGELHREDGPARTFDDKDKYPEYWQHGELHREDGPALVEVTSGYYGGSTTTSWWYKDGELHREDGPAYIREKRPADIRNRTTVEEEWWHNGEPVTPINGRAMPVGRSKPLAVVLSKILGLKEKMSGSSKEN